MIPTNSDLQLLRDLRTSRKALTMETTTAEDKSLWRQLAGSTLARDKPTPKGEAKAKAKKVNYVTDRGDDDASASDDYDAYSQVEQ